MNRESVLAVFDRRVAAVESGLALCRQSPGDEAVHDLRVAIRRLLALLDLLRRPGFGLRVRKLRRDLKAVLSGLGTLRDAQVLCGEGHPPAWLALPGGRAAWALLVAERQAREDAVQRLLATLDSEGLLRRLGKRRQALLAADSQRWQGAVVSALQVAWFEVWQRHRRVSAGSLASIHRERIAFKRFRYTVEIAAELIPALASPADLRALRSYQTVLGELQDACVLCETFRRLSRQLNERGAMALREYARGLRAARVEAYWAGRDGLLRLQAIGVGEGRV